MYEVGFLFFISVPRWLIIESWRQVKRPWSKAVLHQFKTCSRLAKFPHMSHLSSFLIPHLFRLSGVLRPFTDDFKAKESTPLGILLLMLFHPMLLFSSKRRFAKSACSVSFLTQLFHTAKVSSFIVLFPSFFAFFTNASFSLFYYDCGKNLWIIRHRWFVLVWDGRNPTCVAHLGQKMVINTNTVCLLSYKFV